MVSTFPIVTELVDIHTHLSKKFVEDARIAPMKFVEGKMVRQERQTGAKKVTVDDAHRVSI